MSVNSISIDIGETVENSITDSEAQQESQKIDIEQIHKSLTSMLTKNEVIVGDEILCPYDKEEEKIPSHSYHEVCNAIAILKSTSVFMKLNNIIL